MSLKHDIKQLVKPYYLANILLSLSFIVLKRLPGVCNYLFNVEECEFEGRETEILFFLLIVVMMRTRKAGSVSMLNYLTSSFIYTKVANLILWFYADPVMGIIYGIIFILLGLLLPEPTYSGPENVVYFSGLQSLTEELERSRATQTTWLIAFYAAWSPACVTFAPHFADLSNTFHLSNLRFGKVDVGRYPEAGRTHHVSDSSVSKQLPTVVLFENGREVTRRPTVDGRSKLIAFKFSKANLVNAFDLVNLCDRCKKAQKKGGAAASASPTAVDGGHAKND